MLRLTWNVFAIKPPLGCGYDLCLVLGYDGDHVRGPVGQVEGVVPDDIYTILKRQKEDLKASLTHSK